MLKLTKKADYGLIALKHLAARRAKSASAKEIADRYRIPLPLLSKVLQQLSKNGLLLSVQGTNGGYRLAKAANSITVLEVVRTIDGPIILTSCFTEHKECDQSSQCTVREPLRRVHESILSLLDSISIADLLEEGEHECSPTEAEPALVQLGVIPQEVSHG
jgi:Rrf2 family protein